MPKAKKTRAPAAPASLRSVRRDDKLTSLDGATRTLDELIRRELDVNKANWEEVSADLEPPGCSWRTTYREHVKHLLAPYRKEVKDAVPISAAAHRRLEERLANALVCIGERDAKIVRLKEWIAELEGSIEKLSKGTRMRRRRKRTGATARERKEAQE